MARKRGAGRDVKSVFLAELARHGSQRKACEVAGVSRTWVRETKKTDEQFAIDFADALEDSIDRIEETGHSLALKGEEKLIRFFLEVRRYKKQTETDLGEVKPVINITIGGG